MDVVSANAIDCCSDLLRCIRTSNNATRFSGLSTISFLFQHLTSLSSWPCSVPPRQHSGVLVALLPHSMKALGSIPWWKRAFQCRVPPAPSLCGFPPGAPVSPTMKNTFHTTHLFLCSEFSGNLFILQFEIFLLVHSFTQYEENFKAHIMASLTTNRINSYFDPLKRPLSFRCNLFVLEN